jgi:hypothetical protein
VDLAERPARPIENVRGGGSGGQEVAEVRCSQAYFFDGPKPQSIRLHLVRDEVLSIG